MTGFPSCKCACWQALSCTNTSYPLHWPQSRLCQDFIIGNVVHGTVRWCSYSVFKSGNATHNVINAINISPLTHWGRVMHICVGDLSIIASDNGYSPSHYLNQCWNIVNWNLRNKIQCNFDSRKCIWKDRLQNGSYFVSISMCCMSIVASNISMLKPFNPLRTSDAYMCRWFKHYCFR